MKPMEFRTEGEAIAYAESSRSCLVRKDWLLGEHCWVWVVVPDDDRGYDGFGSLVRQVPK